MKIINIDLPKKSKKVLIGINFPIGYLNENDKSFGIGHLTEHYLVSKIIKDFNLADCFGEISNNNINIFLDLNKKQYEQFKKIDLINKLKEFSKNINNKVLQNEKKRIEIELEEKYSDSFLDLSYSIESSFIKSPKILKKNKLDQIKNIKNFKKDEISRFINKLSRTDIKLFVGFAGNKSNFKNKKIKINKLKNNPTFKTGPGKFKTKNPIYKKANNFAICFKGLSAKENMTDRIALSIFSKELYERFNKKVYEIGVYSADYKNLNDNSFGIIWFSINSYKKISENIKDIFYKTIDEILEDKNLEKIIKKTKKEKIQKEKDSWANPYSRFDWIFNDMTEIGNTIEINESIKNIENVNVKTAKKIIGKIFKPENSYILKG